MESPGLIIAPDDEDASNARYANMTFGQGMTITALQVATAFSSVVNGGEYFKPTVVAGEMQNGEFKQYELWEADHATISPETSKTMRKMLVGNRKIYKINPKYDQGYYIGGKTGTAQAVKDGKYVMNETIASYVGFGARDENSEPEYVIIVKFWEDGKALAGDTHAMPAFNEMSAFMLDYLKMKN